MEIEVWIIGMDVEEAMEGKCYLSKSKAEREAASEGVEVFMATTTFNADDFRKVAKFLRMDV